MKRRTFLRSLVGVAVAAACPALVQAREVAGDVITLADFNRMLDSLECIPDWDGHYFLFLHPSQFESIKREGSPWVKIGEGELLAGQVRAFEYPISFRES